VKCLLSLSYENSDVERGFSENNHLVSDDRSSVKIRLKKLTALVLSLTLLNPGIKYEKSGQTKTCKLLRLQNKKKDIDYILNPVRGIPIFLIEIRFCEN
jgi:hypothetical protein